MPGLHPQSRRKAEKRSVDMSRVIQVPPGWVRPPEDECDEPFVYTLTPDGGEPATDRIKVRIVNHAVTNELVDFAVVHETLSAGKWREVTKADSSHEDEVHLHRYGRRGGELGAQPEQLTPIRSAADVADGYDLAYDRVVGDWVHNKARWFDG